MKSLVLCSLCVVFSLASFSQTSASKAYAITSERKGAIQWTEVKLIDLNSGQVIKNVFENSKNEFHVYNARTSKEIRIVKKNGVTDDSNSPFSGFSAACAYDKKLNRLYYAPMFINQLRYIDLNAAVPEVYLFENEPLSGATDLDAEANQVTRMAIAGDGNGYALNNEGTHLVRFTTAEKSVITDLGELKNAQENGEISISDPNTSWGGDMVADASGNLYVISAHNLVFKIEVQSRKATFISKIKDLPEGFTTNGVVVDEDGMIVLSSANFITAYYKVDPSVWTAAIIANSGGVFNASDLANENLLFKTGLAVAVPSITGSEAIATYPNPVKANVFRVSFSNKELGRYIIQLVDMTGRIITDKQVDVGGAGQVSEVRINPSLARGMYMVKVLNQYKKEVFTSKLAVE